MKTHFKHSYILKEFLINLIVSLSVFSFIFVINGIFKSLDIFAKGISFILLSKILYFSLLSSVPYIIPLSILSASTSLFSRLRYDRELHIFLFSGIKPTVLLKNLFFAGIIFSFLLIYYNLFLFPAVKYSGRTYIYSLKNKNPVSLLKPKVLINDFPSFSIYFDELNENLEFKNLSITQKQNKNTLFIKAKSGYIKYNPDKNAFIFVMKNGFLISQGISRITKLDFSEYTFTIKLPEYFSTRIPAKKLSELTFAEIKNRKDLDSKVEIHKRILFGITPLIFIFLGSGIGMHIKGKSKVLNIGVAGFVSLLFFLFLIIGEIISKKTSSSIFIYLPGIVFSFLAYYFLKRMR